MTLGTQIKKLRGMANLTQSQVGNALDISRNAVSAWEIDRVAPSVENLGKLAEMLGVTIADLFSDTLPPNLSADKKPTAKAKANIRVPIRGYAKANYIDVGNAVKKPIGYLNLAPHFANIVDLYAVYTTGDSMSPAHEHGDIRLVSPHSPAKIGDTVVIVKAAQNGEPETSYIIIFKEIKKVSDTRTMLYFGQLNPVAELIFEQSSIIQMHKVLTYNEILGLQ